uniref:Ig-like domain-containing protein n=1 Tax=Eptatretus burgeri TaxID=7764 RepID=A0A8C4QR56_EPTBU
MTISTSLPRLRMHLIACYCCDAIPEWQAVTPSLHQNVFVFESLNTWLPFGKLLPCYLPCPFFPTNLSYAQHLLQTLSSSNTCIVPPSQPVVSGPEKPIGENESIELSCTSNLGNPAGMIYWLKDKKLLYGKINPVDMKGKVRNTVRILVNRRDNGRHVECVVNQLTGVLRTNWTLQVEYRDLPKLEILKTSRNSSVREEQKFECRAKGRPRPSTPQWFHDGKSLSTGLTSGMSNFLVLSDLSLSDTGVYVCISRNELGESKATLNISPPRKLEQCSLIVRVRQLALLDWR